jgi:hypothetical protein
MKTKRTGSLAAAKGGIFTCFIWGLAVLAMAAGCDNSVPLEDMTPSSDEKTITKQPVADKGITVLPSRLIVGKGTRQQFEARFSDGSSAPIKWSIAGNSDDTTEISNEGLLKVGTDEVSDTITVTAALASDLAKYGTSVVSVVGNENIPTEKGLTVSPAIALLDKGVTQKFTAEKSADGVSVSPQWEVLGKTDASTVMDSATGILTVGMDELAAVLTVRADYTGGEWGTAIVNVKNNGSPPPPPINGLNILKI